MYQLKDFRAYYRQIGLDQQWECTIECKENAFVYSKGTGPTKAEAKARAYGWYKLAQKEQS